MPLGLLHIASFIRQYYNDIEILDALIDFDEIGLISRKDDKILFGLSWDDLRKKIIEINPAIVGIGIQFSDYVQYGIKTAEVVKETDERILTVVGGIHPSTSPEYFFNNSNAIDICVIGEGEHTFLDIIKCKESYLDFKKISGIAFKDSDGRTIRTHRRNYEIDLDSFPFPVYELLPMEKYFFWNEKGFSSRLEFKYDGSHRNASIITSRGCIFDCIFCPNFHLMGKKVRLNSAEYILNNIELLVSKYNIKHLHFEDDNMTFKKFRFKKILQGILERKLNITWDTPNGIRADLIDKDLLELSKESGCIYLILGIESGNQYVLNNIVKKKLNLKKVVEVCKFAKDIGLDMRAFYIIGFPGETKENIHQTIEFALDLLENYDVIPQLHVAKLMEGSEMYEICKKNNYIREVKLETTMPVTVIKGSLEMVETEEFSAQEIIEFNAKFNEEVSQILFKKTLNFLNEHPFIIEPILQKAVTDFNKYSDRDKILNVIYNNYLLFKNSLLNRINNGLSL